MKALITNVTFEKEWHSEKWNKTYYIFNVFYDNKQAQFMSTNKEQKKFVSGQEAEFTEEQKEYQGEKQYVVKAIMQGQSNYSRAAKKEQSRYSGFAVSYCKDLVIAGKLDLKQWEAASKKIFNFMVELDKSIES